MKKFIITLFFLTVIFTYISMIASCFAAQQSQGEIASSDSSQEVTTSSSRSANTLITSVKESDDSRVEFGLSEAINVILCAIGIVIIFLGIAILIKIKR